MTDDLEQQPQGPTGARPAVMPEDFPPLAAPPKAYDAFISYRHDGNREVARALQRGLQRMAKPWHQRRALQVFRDETGLSADPSLWRSICAAMDGAEWLVYLASPESRSSDWVGHELRRWLRYKRPDRIMIAITAGSLRWNDDGSVDTSSEDSAVHPALAGVVSPDTKYIDISWARSETGLTLRHPRFRDAIADLAAPMHGKPKDELEGDDVREQRRALRLARSAVAGLTALTLAAGAASVLAVANAQEAAAQRDVARTEQARAEEQARVATSQLLAAQALDNPGVDGSLGYLLAARAYRLAPTTAALGALYQLTQVDSGRSAQVLAGGEVSGRVTGHSAAVEAASFSPDATALATVDGSALRVFPGDGGPSTAQATVPGAVAVSWTDDSGLIAGGPEGAVLVDPGTGQTTDLGQAAGGVVGLASAGETVLALAGDGTLLRVEDGGLAPVGPRVPGAEDLLGAAGAGLVVVAGPGEAVLVDTVDGGVVSRVSTDGLASDLSADGQELTVVYPESPLERATTAEGEGWVVARVLDTRSGRVLREETVFEPYLPRAATFLPGAATLVIGTSGGVDGAPGQLFVRDPDPGVVESLGRLTPPDTLVGVMVSDDGSRLLVTDEAGTGLVLPLSSATTTPTSPLATARDAPRVLVEGEEGVEVVDLASRTVLGGVTSATGGALTPDGTQLLTEGGRLVAVDGGTTLHDGLPAVGGAAVFSPDGNRALYPTDEPAGTVALVDLGEGSSSTLALDGRVVALDWSPDGDDAVALTETSDSDSRTLWSLGTDAGLAVRASEAVTPQTDALVLLGGGALVVGDGSTAETWDAETLARTSTSAYAPVGRSWALSPDGGTLMTTGPGCHLMLVDPETWQVAADVEVDARFSEGGCEAPETSWADSGSVIVTSLDGRMRTIPTDPEVLLEQACSLAARDLSEAEWAQFLPDRPYEATCAPQVNGDAPEPTLDAQAAAPAPSTGGEVQDTSAGPTAAAVESAAPRDEPRGEPAPQPSDPAAPESTTSVPEHIEPVAAVDPEADVCGPDLRNVPCLGVFDLETDEAVVGDVRSATDLAAVHRLAREDEAWVVVDTHDFGTAQPVPDWATVVFDP